MPRRNSSFPSRPCITIPEISLIPKPASDLGCVSLKKSNSIGDSFRKLDANYHCPIPTCQYFCSCFTSGYGNTCFSSFRNLYLVRIRLKYCFFVAEMANDRCTFVALRLGNTQRNEKLTCLFVNGILSSFRTREIHFNNVLY
ncbi:hypothetical protein ACOME3_002420 [Neoechinorhynchus agilis]